MGLDEMIKKQLEDEQNGISEYSALLVKVSEEIKDEGLKNAIVAGISKLKEDEQSHYNYLTLLQKLLNT